MEVLANLATGFGIALTPENLLYALIGAFLGTAVGVLPGLGSPATIALLLPVTYAMEPVSAIIMLAGIYYGAQFGGSTTSILLNIPGEAAAVVTCLDGYQMARQGRAGPALGIAALGSFFGAVVSIIGLALIAPLLADFGLKFGPPEYFSLVLVGLMMAVYLSEGSVLKGLIMGVFGLLLGTVGLDPALGVERFTFGIPRLTSGLHFVVVGMGFFGIGEVLTNLENPQVRSIFKASLKGLLPNLEDWKRSWAAIVRGASLGLGIGVLPGGGAVISSFVSYAIEKRVSKEPERFGKGTIEGVAGPETANNAAATSSFIPLMTLGIPGNLSIAMIFIAMMIHGVRPGPLLLRDHPDLFWGVVASMFAGNLMLVALNLPLIGMWVRLMSVPYRYLVVVIVLMCAIGAYSVNFTAFDVGALAVFGVFGYLCRKGGFPAAPMVLAMVLGRILESSMQQSLIMGGGDPVIFVERPISATLLAVGALLMLKPMAQYLWRRRRPPAAGRPPAE
ncbi:MAG: tripartite tricarboxylate transporter permease [Rhodospirillales bacterium]|jgi:putative tricarboxylic transport membrane protein|nr:tripartite tricarboxylate transporter permease [Rhodospirillales bacterium]MDP6642527.1 tripartite tricarboxylate transporter permease [Rhodospirillales bacterium]MDP6843440.1 tripartite tricarboxylate transporter permease [Rhodospirillales bacterium]